MQIANLTIDQTTKVITITTSPAVVGVEGKDAYQVWLQDNPGGTKEDWMDALTPKLSLRINDLGKLILTRK